MPKRKKGAGASGQAKTGYVDGFVIPLPRKNAAAYRRMAREGARLFKKYGATDFKECQADDLKSMMGQSFKKQFKLKPGETVFFSWVGYRSKAARDRANARMMKDPDMAGWEGKMPFDVKRMVYGGFKVAVGM